MAHPLARTATAHSVDDPFSTLANDAAKLQDAHSRLEAKAASDAIDAQLAAEKEHNKRHAPIRLLLLGQAESGKTTLQKQFQLLYAPASLDHERLNWKIVIYLNIVRALRPILDAIHDFIQKEPGKSDKALATLRLSLTPILTMEQSLSSELTGGIQLSSNTPSDSIYSRLGWQFVSYTNSRGKRISFAEDSEPRTLGDKSKVILPMERMLVSSRDDLSRLWSHSAVRRILKDQKFQAQEWAEYFLSNIERVASKDYVPTDDDILHARIQTLGVAEHHFEVKSDGRLVSWHLYDVGGARGQRHVWASYFTEANAIIFLTPISAFDQLLEEDSNVNRMQDSVELFKQVCSNKLLERVHIVLFLNKADLLRQKLESGIQLKQFIISYADRPNRYDDVVAYFKTHFVQVHNKNTPRRNRYFYTHVTSMVDTRATRQIIINVHDTVFRTHLKEAALV